MRSLSRVEIVRELLATLVEARDSVSLHTNGNGQEWNDSRELRMSWQYHAGSYAELERCLAAQHDLERLLWWNVTHRYLRSRKTTTWTCRACRKPLNITPDRWQGFKQADCPPPRDRWHRHGHKRKLVEPVWGLWETWDANVQALLVEEGERWLASRMRVCELPLEIYALAAA